MLRLHCRRIFLRNCELPVRIGVYAHEKSQAQRIRLNVEMYVLLTDSTTKDDDLSHVVDYDIMRQSIVNRITQGHIELQETLCDDIAAQLLQHPKVQAVRISTEKPDIYSDCEAVGIEVFRVKAGALNMLHALPTP